MAQSAASNMASQADSLSSVTSSYASAVKENNDSYSAAMSDYVSESAAAESYNSSATASYNSALSSYNSAVSSLASGYTEVFNSSGVKIFNSYNSEKAASATSYGENGKVLEASGGSFSYYNTAIVAEDEDLKKLLGDEYFLDCNWGKLENIVDLVGAERITPSNSLQNSLATTTYGQADAKEIIYQDENGKIASFEFSYRVKGVATTNLGKRVDALIHVTGYGALSKNGKVDVYISNRPYVGMHEQYGDVKTSFVDEDGNLVNGIIPTISADIDFNQGQVIKATNGSIQVFLSEDKYENILATGQIHSSDPNSNLNNSDSIPYGINYNIIIGNSFELQGVKHANWIDETNGQLKSGINYAYMTKFDPMFQKDDFVNGLIESANTWIQYVESVPVHWDIKPLMPDLKPTVLAPQYHEIEKPEVMLYYFSIDENVTDYKGPGNKPLYPRSEGENSNPPEIPGYYLTNPKSPKDDGKGNWTYYYEENNTSWIDIDTGKKLKETENGLLAKGDFPLYSFVKKTLDEKGNITWYFKKVSPTKKTKVRVGFKKGEVSFNQLKSTQSDTKPLLSSKPFEATKSDFSKAVTDKQVEAKYELPKMADSSGSDLTIASGIALFLSSFILYLSSFGKPKRKKK